MYKTKQPAFYRHNTHDTGAELTLFYNMALDRMNNLLSRYENTAIDIAALDYSRNQLFKKDTYLHLQVYLWKEPISANFATLTDKDRRRIHQFLEMLVHVRNFQSHYYHDAKVLRFPKDLIRFIQSRFTLAEQDLTLKNPNFIKYVRELYEDVTTFESRGKKREDRYRHFDFFTESGFITEEGKNFFLSFFLLKGEMNHFLKKRKRCKKDNGEKYQVKTRLYTWYCHRDGSNRFFLQSKKDYINDEEKLKRQYNSLLNYLKSIPLADRKYLPPTKETELHPRISKEEKQQLLEQWRQEEQEAVIYPRRKDKFMELAIRYFMDRKLLGHQDTTLISWQVRNFEMEVVEKTKYPNYSKDKAYYLKKKHPFKHTYSEGEYPVIRKDHIKFILDRDENTEYVINKRELKNWLYYLHSYKNRRSFEDCITLVKEYGQQHRQAMQQLCDKNKISFEKYPLVFEAGADSRILSAMYKKILKQDSFDETQYRKAILKRLQATLNKMRAHLEKENVDTYNRHKKNRIIMQCLNWYLPEEAKLKPVEVNQLSIYNFVAENEHLNAETRNQIIADLRHKLEKATDVVFEVLQKAKSLDDAYNKMLQKLISLLERYQKNLTGITVEDLHPIATRLKVSLPGITYSRGSENREAELKETIAKKPVLIPNGLFKRAFEAKGYSRSVSTDIVANPSWTKLLMEGHYSLKTQDAFINHPEYGLKDIATQTLKVVEENYDLCFKQHCRQHGQPFRTLIDAMLSCFGMPAPARKEIVNAVNYKRKLREVMACDTLLAVLFFEYHNSHLPLEERETAMVNLAGLHEHEYRLEIPGHQPITLKYKQLDDLATHWNRKRIEKLFSNQAYWSEEALAQLEEKKPKTDQQRILIMMHKVWQDSFYYIRSFLDVEKKGIERQLAKKALKKLLQRSKALNPVGAERIEGRAVLELWKNITEEQREKFIELRNNAFHTDIPENHRRYEEEKDALCELTGIPKPEKRQGYKG